jgi:hypothetical protein
LEHLVGFKIKSGKFVALKQDWYPRVDFYDDDPQNIHYANDIQKFFEEILRKTDDEVFHLVVERLDSTKMILKNYLVTTNQTNRFVESTVELKQPVRFPIMENKNEKPKMKYIKEFKEFVNESETATPVKTPVKTPTKTPSPNRPSPIRRDRPSVDPKPKATIDDVVNRVKDVMDDELVEIIKNKYE